MKAGTKTEIQNLIDSRGMELRPKLTVCAIGSAQSPHVQNRVKCFAERGHKVYLINTGLDGSIEEVQVITPRLLYIPKVRAIFRLLGYFQTIRRCQADIFHIHYAHNILGWMTAVIGHHPLVVSIMGGDILFEEQAEPTPRSRWLTLQLLESADLITAKSDYLISVLNELGRFDSKATRVIWGVDLAQFRRVDASKLRRELDLSSDDLIIFSPKILRPFYNIHLVVEAMPRILGQYPKAKLLVADYNADATYKADIVARIQSLGLQKYVVFIEAIKHEDMPRYYSVADVVVAVPPSDGLPQALLEAMACEVPNVLSRLPRYEEIVTDRESVYFVDISSEGIADGIIQLLGDTHLRRKIIQNGL